MNADIRKILEAADCDTGWEIPKDNWETFPYEDYISDIKLIQEKISEQLDVELKRDGSVQDASFIDQLFILDDSAFMGNGVIAHIYQFAIRFSNFGKLYTIYSHVESNLNESTVKQVMQIVEGYGWIYVPRKALKKPYDGKHSGFIGQEWWIRFFDYI